MVVVCVPFLLGLNGEFEIAPFVLFMVVVVFSQYWHQFGKDKNDKSLDNWQQVEYSKGKLKCKTLMSKTKKLYCRYDSYDFNERSTFVRSGISERIHENSLKDGNSYPKVRVSTKDLQRHEG